jgi:hypothetical protein
MKQLLRLKSFAFLTFLLIAMNTNVTSQPFVEVLQPSEANIYWEIGSTKLISWNSNFTQPVKIELLKDGIFELEIAASVTGSTYSWFIDPSILPDSDYRIKVSSTVNSSFNAVSSNDFSLVLSLPGGYIHVEQPNTTGINWFPGTDNLISWDSNLSGLFKIELLDEVLLTSTTIANNVGNSTFIWSVPALFPTGENYKIKVSSVSDPGVFDLSDNPFSILITPSNSTIEVLQPTEPGISWVKGSSYLLSWIDDVPGPVNIELYSINPFIIASNDASDYTTWITGDDEGDGFGPWVITSDAPTGTAQALLGDPSLSFIDGMDNPSFGIIAYSAASDLNNFIYADKTFDSPLEVGSTFSFDWGVRWSTGSKGFYLYSGGIDADELIHVSLEGITTEITINGAPMFLNNGAPLSEVMNLSFEFVSETELRVFGNGRDGVESFDQTFIVSGAPDAIRFYSKGQVAANYLNRINYFDNFKITRHTMDIASGVIGSTHVWTIPSGISAANSNYKINIWDETETILGQSLNYFSIVNNLPGSYITVLQPSDNGITWLRGSSYLISWIDDVPGTVNIQLYKNGSHHATLASNVAGSTWVWNVPALTYATGADYKIRVVASNGGVSDLSDFDFTIADFPSAGSIEVLQPNVSGIKWLRGSAYVISWLPDFLSGPSEIQLWKGGSALATLATGVEGTTWVWNIPALTYPLGNDYKIRVYTNNNSVYGESDFDFELSDSPGGTIEVLQPNGGEFLYKGTGYLISWIDDVPEAVNIELLRYDNFDVLQETYPLTNSAIGTTHIWNVSNLLPTGSFYKIRVFSSALGTIEDFSDNYFTISDLPLTFSVYPNPAKDFVNIKFDDMANETFIVELADRFNLLTISRTIDGSSMKEMKISTTDLPNGIYFLTITSDKTKTTQKVMIQR